MSVLNFRPTLSGLEARETPSWWMSWWAALNTPTPVSEPQTPVQTSPPVSRPPLVVVSPPVLPPTLVTPPVPATAPPVVTAPPATPASPPLAETAALPAVNAGIVAFAKANVGVPVDPANGADCYDFAAAALRAAGAKPQWQLGTDGPIGNHYRWGDLVYQKSLIGGYGDVGSLADVRPGDVVQMEQFRQQSPDGSWASAPHDTQVVGSVNAATGVVQTFRQNWNGQKFVTQGQLNVSDMTSGVFSVYRPLPA